MAVTLHSATLASPQVDLSSAMASHAESRASEQARQSGARVEKRRDRTAEKLTDGGSQTSELPLLCQLGRKRRWEDLLVVQKGRYASREALRCRAQ
jgi:hypothetical protein